MGDVTETNVRFERRGALGHVILDRPKAINSLTLPMVTALHTQLREWAQDDAVKVVAITGAGEKGLCAGGDVVSVRRALLDGDPDAAMAFFDTEYDVDGLIGAYPKPVVAFMDGVCMGGGRGSGGSGPAARCCGVGVVTTRPATLTRRAHVRGIMEA